MNEAVIDALACHRLSRLVASDVITQPARDALIRYLYARRGDRDARRLDPPADSDWTARALHDGPDAPKLATLLVCRWCASAHLAIVVVILRRVAPRAWNPIAKALAFSSVAGMLGILEHFAEPQKIIEVDAESQG